MCSFRLAGVVSLALFETVIQHFGELRVADFQFLLVLKGHEINFFDGEAPEKFAE